MSHLTEEQFEEEMQGGAAANEHLGQCGQCRERLAEKEALAARLRSAFTDIKSEEGLAERIRGQLNVYPEAAGHPGSQRFVKIRSHWRALLAATSAAAALIVIVPLVIYLAQPPSAAAAFVEFHEHNLSANHENHEFYAEDDPEKLAEYFESKLGFSPSMPRPGRGMSLRGCCVRHFRGEIVGSYVVDTAKGVMSIVVVTDRPETLGMGRKFQHGKYTFWKSSFAKCEMVTARLGGYSYCAVGEISHTYLTELLAQLLDDFEQ